MAPNRCGAALLGGGIFPASPGCPRRGARSGRGWRLLRRPIAPRAVLPFSRTVSASIELFFCEHGKYMF
ncbi:hypothetical protein AV530_005916 [Patagioenas fasciata monilis]|uniref:Uncharacterized protein n=1 Tax=Patagioenas fasciata monilis TaxID=372326 RepID=A0A1V4JNA7_PATFA|nr:hypothetical protein AV530_005916 [Patagioenas fasciata monilis]